MGPELTEEDKHWVALNMVLGVGKTLFSRLIQRFGTARAVFQASRNELMEVEGIGGKTADQVCQFDLEKQITRELGLAEKLGAGILTFRSEQYPALLKTIYDPPPVLYYQGKPPHQFAVPLAVVGTRSSTNYGKIVAHELCTKLSQKGVTLVSGMARGIDTLAHRAALESGGNTMAVFGCGLDYTYPPENRKLREQIIAHGSVISEFPISTRPDRNNFPARNRVISGLSLGTLVVEAGEKSGALITAEFAVEQGREVFAVPGNINSPNSIGTNRLIQTGAKMVCDVESIVEEWSEETQSLLKQENGKDPARDDEKPNLSEKERAVWGLLSREEKHIDELILGSGLSAGEVSATLVQLELRGMVREVEGKKFITNRL